MLEHLAAWENGTTGFPFIDAIMTQLKTEGVDSSSCKAYGSMFFDQR